MEVTDGAKGEEAKNAPPKSTYVDIISQAAFAQSIGEHVKKTALS
jgi:hypothetical protein